MAEHLQAIGQDLINAPIPKVGPSEVGSPIPGAALIRAGTTGESMKKIVALGLTVALFSSTAVAGTTKVSIPVTATAESVCVFDAAVTAATLTYKATTGGTQTAAGKAKLYCTPGTFPTMTTTQTSEEIPKEGTGYKSRKGDLLLLDLLSSTPQKLNVKFQIDTDQLGAAPAGSGYEGASQFEYTLTVSALADQWGFSGSLSGAVEMNITF